MSKSLPNGRAGHRIAVLLVRLGAALTLNLGVEIPSPAQTPPPRDLTQFSLEDLMNVQVTSVSKKEQKLSKTGAAILSSTKKISAVPARPIFRTCCGWCRASMWRRSTPTNWAISIRGFNSAISNKILVLIDGRSCFTPTLSLALTGMCMTFPWKTSSASRSFGGPGGTRVGR